MEHPGRRSFDLPLWPPWVRFVLAPWVTPWEGLSLTRLTATAFVALLFARQVGTNDVLAMFVIVCACLAKDFKDFERVSKIFPRFGRRDTDPVRQAAVETALKAEETKDAARDVVAAIDKAPPADEPTVPDMFKDDETGDDGEPARAP